MWPDVEAPLSGCRGIGEQRTRLATIYKGNPAPDNGVAVLAVEHAARPVTRVQVSQRHVPGSGRPATPADGPFAGTAPVLKYRSRQAELRATRHTVSSW